MALLAPSTPTAQVSPVAIDTPSPGTWQHPKLDEIARRKNAATFTHCNVRKILWNGGALVILWFARDFVYTNPGIKEVIIPRAAEKYASAIFNLLGLLSLFNIIMSFYPLLMKKDNLTDIDLTPSQRALLGLDPDAAPPTTPKTQYITPPRYPRSSTPRNNFSGSRCGSNAGSPLPRKRSPLSGLQDIVSPSPPTPTPMWQKAVTTSHEASRRHSFGSPSPLGVGWKDTSVLGMPSTPSPSGTGSSVPLNNRWLYARGKVSPGSRMPKIYV